MRKGDMNFAPFILSLVIAVGIIAMFSFLILGQLGQVKVSVNRQQERIEVIQAAQLISHCLTADGPLSEEALDQAVASGSGIEELVSGCGLELEVNAKVTDLITDKEWPLDFEEGSGAAGDSLIVSIAAGDDIHSGRLYVQSEA